MRGRFMANLCNEITTFRKQNSYASKACYAVRFVDTAKAVAKRQISEL